MKKETEEEEVRSGSEIDSNGVIWFLHAAADICVVVVAPSPLLISIQYMRSSESI